MPTYLAALSTGIRTTAVLLGIDVQKDPTPALFLAALVCVALWFLVGQARRRDARRANRNRDRDLSGWRSRQPPRA